MLEISAKITARWKTKKTITHIKFLRDSIIIWVKFEEWVSECDPSWTKEIRYDKKRIKNKVRY